MKMQKDIAPNPETTLTNTPMNMYRTDNYTCLADGCIEFGRFRILSCGIEPCIVGKSAGPYNRPGYHIHAVVSGKGILNIDGKVIPVHENQIFVLKPEETVIYKPVAGNPWFYVWVALDGEDMEEYIHKAGFVPGVNVLDCNVNVHDFVDYAYKILQIHGDDLPQNLHRISLACEYLALCVESNQPPKEKRHKKKGYPSDVYVENALNYIHIHYRDARIQDMADYIGINRSYLTYIFKQKTGMSPQKYMLTYRMNIATELLLGTQASIQEVAHKVGYENPFTFSKMFKSVYSLSPTDYRKKHLSEEEP